MKEERIYYFSVEGQTEKLYLKHLEKLINQNLKSECVFFNIIITTQPVKRVRNLPKDDCVICYHLCDVESQDKHHKEVFEKTLKELDKQKKDPRVLDYKLGYSNMTFDLFLILHKLDAFSKVAGRKNYIRLINKAFSTDFRGMQEFKRAQNVNTILKQITLDDVFDAIEREKQLAHLNKHAGYKPIRFKGYSYYKESPSLSVGSILEEILMDLTLERSKS